MSLRSGWANGKGGVGWRSQHRGLLGKKGRSGAERSGAESVASLPSGPHLENARPPVFCRHGGILVLRRLG